MRGAASDGRPYRDLSGASAGRKQSHRCFRLDLAAGTARPGWVEPGLLGQLRSGLAGPAVGSVCGGKSGSEIQSELRYQLSR